MIKLTTQGGEVKELHGRDGSKLSLILEHFEIKIKKGETITINNEKVRFGGRFFWKSDPIVNDGDSIIITPAIGNG